MAYFHSRQALSSHLESLTTTARLAHQRQTNVDLARIAIATERFRSATGAYPQQQAMLTPTYIDAIPQDNITGKPLQHRLHGERFIIYSLGWNATDDGGVPDKRSEPGDWGWRYPDDHVDQWKFKNSS